MLKILFNRTAIFFVLQIGIIFGLVLISKLFFTKEISLGQNNAMAQTVNNTGNTQTSSQVPLTVANVNSTDSGNTTASGQQPLVPSLLITSTGDSGNTVAGGQTPLFAPTVIPTATPTFVLSPTPTPMPAVKTAIQEVRGSSFPQCGGTVGLENFPTTHTIMVTPINDQNGHLLRFEHQDLGDLGQCPPQARPTIVVTPTLVPPVVVVTPAAVKIPLTISQQVTQQPVSPTITTGTPPPMPSGPIQSNISMNNQNINTNTQSQTSPIIVAVQPTVAPQTVVVPKVVVIATPTPIPIAITTPTPTVALGPSQQVLPQTGVPLSVWALGGLFPAGFAIQKVTKDIKEYKNRASYIWQRKQFSKEDKKKLS